MPKARSCLPHDSAVGHRLCYTGYVHLWSQTVLHRAHTPLLRGVEDGLATGWGN